MKHLFLYLLLFIISCSGINFVSIGSKKKRYKATNNPKISNIFKTGKVMQYKDFGNWKNDYLNDIKFDIFLDSNGSRIGIISEDKKSIKIEEKSFKKIYNNDTKLDFILNEFERIVSRDVSKNLNNDLMSVIVDIRKDEINKAMENILRESNDINESNVQNDKEDIDVKRGNYYTYKQKTLGSNRHIKLILMNYDDLMEWNDDSFVNDALFAFSKTCDVFGGREKYPIRTKNLSLSTSDKWYNICLNIKNVKSANYARDFFEKYFIPVKVFQGKFGRYTDRGVFTGYYELDLEGSKEKSSLYPYPIYDLPSECKNKQCLTKSDIFDGKLEGRGLELFWAKSYIDIYFLQIQGSGIVLFEDGSFNRVGFAGTNRRDTSNIFKYMKKKCIPKCNANLTEMINWFDGNPKDGMDVLARSDSYVFFRKLENNGDGAIGSQGVALTPTRSLAVDNEMIPYGVPIWLETRLPIKKKDGSWLNLNRLFIAQDTGGAINGAIRGDIFFGHGTKAKFLAEKQKFDGGYFILVPRSIINDIKVL